MKGVAFDKIGASPTILDGIETSEPADGQILVKSIYTAINPVDGFMASTGILIVQWPFVMGCDAAGIVVKAGASAAGPLGPFQVGGEVLGCTRLGSKGHSTCQEHFLMDARVTTPKPKNITLAQAATVGVAFYVGRFSKQGQTFADIHFRTACLGVFDGLAIALPDPTKLSDWGMGRTYPQIPEDLVKTLFAKVEGRKYFSTTNDWTPMVASDFS
ncbi:GroES-like protein [Venturia nashicola]|uniref:GroES-like protein n=1 Tax=Venturia nashicola TaxID=86259 RepID=A0A4Z1P3J1_9PEZI|nr:GroES-like protein [Venturia nashicola]